MVYYSRRGSFKYFVENFNVGFSAIEIIKDEKMD
jgi:hypothetical protein